MGHSDPVHCFEKEGSSVAGAEGRSRFSLERIRHLRAGFQWKRVFWRAVTDYVAIPGVCIAVVVGSQGSTEYCDS